MRVSYIKRLNGTLLTALVFALAVVFQPVSAATTLFSFTQDELETNWGPERIAPSGGYSSVSFGGRTNVAKISIDSTKAFVNPAEPTSTYYRVEGIKNPKNEADSFLNGGNFGESVQVDFYLDPAWDNNAGRAGLWTVGNDGSDGTDPTTYPFGILEFANVSGYEGFRYYNPSVGYVPVAGFNPTTDYGKWVTFKIALDPAANQYVYSINGTQVAASASPEPSTYLHSVMLNQRNFGLEPQAGLTNNSYAAHWHGGVTQVMAKSKDDCKKDEWKSLVDKNGNGFKNQGQCVSSVANKK